MPHEMSRRSHNGRPSHAGWAALHGRGVPGRGLSRYLTVGLVLVGLAAVGVPAAGCTGASPDQNVSPLEDDATREARPSDQADPSETPPGALASGAQQQTPAQESTEKDHTTEEQAQREVADLLGRFDTALTALYADPLAAGDDTHPLSVAWLDVVVGGSQLDRQVRGRVLASGTADRMRIVPDEHGTSFTNVALEVTKAPDGSLTWTNCGYAPGVGIDIDTGEVLDDNRTSTRGRGTAVRSANGALSISELWDDETVILDPGDPDPCIALADQRGGGNR